jgi:hypothetical protein
VSAHTQRGFKQGVTDGDTDDEAAQPTEKQFIRAEKATEISD